MTEWQPIETLPEANESGDGFLVYWPKSLRGKAEIDRLGGRQEYDDIVSFGEPPATHWMPLPAPPGGSPLAPERPAQEEFLREALVAARDALAAFQKDAGWLPEQQAYSTKLTDAERKLADAVSSIDAILAAPLPRSEPQPPATSEDPREVFLAAHVYWNELDSDTISGQHSIEAAFVCGAAWREKRTAQPAAGTGGVPPALDLEPIRERVRRWYKAQDGLTLDVANGLADAALALLSEIERLRSGRGSGGE